MAIIFEMWAECGTEQDCLALVKHFNGVQCTLLSGLTISWQAAVANWLPTGMTVWAPELSRSGVRTLQDAVNTTEVGLHWYHHLKTGPAFRFARVAWEAENIPLSDLKDYVAPMMPGECRFEVKCVLDETLYEELGSPQFCFPFRDGYRWTRYWGEQYMPLGSNDQAELNQLERSLFPEHFRKRH